jgi:hypothetical protein
MGAAAACRSRLACSNREGKCVMALHDEHLPVIEREDYPAFPKLPHSVGQATLPETFEEWQQLHVKEKVRLENLGHTVEEIPITSADFRASREDSDHATLVDLRLFVMDIVHRRNKIADPRLPPLGKP